MVTFLPLSSILPFNALRLCAVRLPRPKLSESAVRYILPLSDITSPRIVTCSRAEVASTSPVVAKSVTPSATLRLRSPEFEAAGSPASIFILPAVIFSLIWIVESPVARPPSISRRPPLRFIAALVVMLLSAISVAFPPKAVMVPPELLLMLIPLANKLPVVIFIGASIFKLPTRPLS